MCVCVVSEVQQDNEHGREQGGYPFHLGVKFQWIHQEQETQSKCKVSMPDEGAAGNLEKPCLLLKPELVSNAKSYLFMAVLCLRCYAQV